MDKTLVYKDSLVSLDSTTSTDRKLEFFYYTRAIKSMIMMRVIRDLLGKIRDQLDNFVDRERRIIKTVTNDKTFVLKDVVIRMKSFERFIVKTITDYGGDPNQVLDLYGGRLTVKYRDGDARPVLSDLTESKTNETIIDLLSRAFKTVTSNLAEFISSDGIVLSEADKIMEWTLFKINMINVKETNTEIINMHFRGDINFEIQIINFTQDHIYYEINRLPRNSKYYIERSYSSTIFGIIESLMDGPIDSEKLKQISILRELIVSSPIDPNFQTLLNCLHDPKVKFYNHKMNKLPDGRVVEAPAGKKRKSEAGVGSKK